MQERIVTGWNDLDRYEPGRTRNLHYTEIRTQPWVYAAHPLGQLWVDELALMLDSGAISAAELEEEVRLGYVRPSLLPQLGLGGETPDGGAATRPKGLNPELLLAFDEPAASSRTRNCSRALPSASARSRSFVASRPARGIHGSVRGID